MKTKLKKPLIIALSLIPVLIIGIMAYYWNSQVNHLKLNRNKDALRIQELKSKLQQAQSSRSISEADQQQYLEIKEWGVKLKLERATQVTYELQTDGKAQTANFKIRGESIDTSTCIDATKNLDISLTRSSSELENMLNEPTKIGAYYFYASGSPYICNADVNNDNAPRNQVVQQLNQALKDFLKS